MRRQAEAAEEKARRLAEAIIKVRAGEMTAREATRSLGISAKTYYKWEKRALQALMGALREQPGGRKLPPRDPEKEELKQERDRWRRQALVWEQRNRIREALDKPGGAKKKGRGRSLDGSPHANATPRDGSAIPGDLSPVGTPLLDIHEVAGEDRERAGSRPSRRPPSPGVERGGGAKARPGDRSPPSRKGADGGDGGAVPKVARADLAPGGPAASGGVPPRASAEEKAGDDAYPVVDAGGGLGDG